MNKPIDLLTPPPALTFKNLRNDKKLRKFLTMLDKYMPLFKDADVLEYKLGIMSENRYSIEIEMLFEGDFVRLTFGKGD